MSNSRDTSDFCVYMKYLFSGKRDPVFEASIPPTLWVTFPQLSTYIRASEFVATRPRDQFTSSYERALAILTPLTRDEYFRMLDFYNKPAVDDAVDDVP